MWQGLEDRQHTVDIKQIPAELAGSISANHMQMLILPECQAQSAVRGAKKCRTGELMVQPSSSGISTACAHDR